MKRILPFFLTFAFGLLIASFFVSITPNFKFQKRGWSRHQQYHQRLESENQRLRDENNLLKRKLLEEQSMMEPALEIKRIETVSELPPPPPQIKTVRVR